MIVRPHINGERCGISYVNSLLTEERCTVSKQSGMTSEVALEMLGVCESRRHIPGLPSSILACPNTGLAWIRWARWEAFLWIVQLPCLWSTPTVGGTPTNPVLVREA
ncbi:hypothetical protein ElyMa_005998300 [Elysia marginata]|uniref:Uncharacterized protein n=1 Tax=Elysia marginata TaxID=1093978 RepID=A0AAV4GGY0_9GAST|nr:hypothetical protein ElyMa_005998300 [Elysia marginata]